MLKRNLTLFLLIILFPAVLFSQNQNSNWHFGDGLSMNFSGGTVSSGTAELFANGLEQPSSISDPSGNVICYTDGDKVYNSSDALIHDFSAAASECLLVPDPSGDDRYYLFRSGTNGLTYSIVDMTLNDGAGGINEDEENIDLGDYNVQMVAARNVNANDYWLVVSHNQNGNSEDVTATVYSITADGVTEGDSEGQYYIFGGWYATIDDMRIAPDCSKIVMAYKGHYLVLIQFNNETGMLSNLLTSSLDAGNSFGTADLDQWEFSSDGNYLFDLEDQNGLTRYSLEDWNISSIGNSAEVIQEMNWGVDIWKDLKLGMDGSIYLMNTQDGQIDKIINTSGSSEDIEIIENVLTFEDGLTSYFPNTYNFSCISLDAGVFHLYECLGDSTEFWYSASIAADSVYWDFGDPNTGASNFSTEDEPIHIFSETGVFEVTLHVFFEGNESTYPHPLTIYTVPEFELGPDLTFCEGGNTQLGVNPTSGYSYDWSTGQATSFINATESGMYELEITNGACHFTDSVEVIVLYEIGSTLEEEIVVCDGEPITISAGSSNAQEIEWNTGQTTEEIEVSTSGTYTVTISNECFEDVYSTEVIFVNIPDLLPESTLSGCNGDTLGLTSNYQQGSVEWSTGSDDYSIQVTESGVYSITAEYLGCTRTDEIEVDLQDFIPMEWIVMPNVFTPDGDDKNQVFRPFISGDPDFALCNSPVVEIHMNVYNRWGNLLAEDVCSWNGKSSGPDLFYEGVYYYIIDIQSACFERQESKKTEGFVHLLLDK